MFGWLKRKQKNKNDYIDPDTGERTESALIHDRNNARFLKLKDDTCAMVIHPGGKIEVIFTRLYNEETQEITPEEETLMSIALFMKQPGFSEMLLDEFHKIAMSNVNELIKDDK